MIKCCTKLNTKIIEIEKVLDSWRKIKILDPTKIIKCGSEHNALYFIHKRDRVKRNTLVLLYGSEGGGVNMIDIDSYFKALTAFWFTMINKK